MKNYLADFSAKELQELRKLPYKSYLENQV